MIQTFKTGGANGAACDLFINCPLPPDFQSFWTQASQQDWNPKLATVAKVMLFPTDAYALGDLSNNIATDAWFTPYSPYKSSLTGQSAYAFAAAYQKAGHGQWVSQWARPTHCSRSRSRSQEGAQSHDDSPSPKRCRW